MLATKRHIDIAPRDMDTLTELLRKQLPGRDVLAFGSRVTGNAKQFSDLDLAILGEEPIPAAALASLGDALDESNLPFKVDIVDWATTNDSFRRVIERQAVQLLPHSPSQ